MVNTEDIFCCDSNSGDMEVYEFDGVVCISSDNGVVKITKDSAIDLASALLSFYKKEKQGD